MCEFITAGTPHKRFVETDADTISVRRIYSPTWQRFRYLVDHVEQMVFLHSAKTRGNTHDLSTFEAFDLACEHCDSPAQQYSVQQQGRARIGVQELRTSRCIGTAHLYLYARRVAGLGDDAHHIGYFRIESWRQIDDIVQPGIGRRELVLPDTSQQRALLHLLHEGLKELQTCQPYRLVIHQPDKQFPTTVQRAAGRNADLCHVINALLTSYAQVSWSTDTKRQLQQEIGKPIRMQQELWYHRKAVRAAQGLYQ